MFDIDRDFKYLHITTNMGVGGVSYIKYDKVGAILFLIFLSTTTIWAFSNYSEARVMIVQEIRITINDANLYKSI